jgi:hypothetical protein
VTVDSVIGLSTTAGVGPELDGVITRVVEPPEVKLAAVRVATPSTTTTTAVADTMRRRRW